MVHSRFFYPGSALARVNLVFEHVRRVDKGLRKKAAPALSRESAPPWLTLELIAHEASQYLSRHL